MTSSLPGPTPPDVLIAMNPAAPLKANNQGNLPAGRRP